MFNILNDPEYFSDLGDMRTILQRSLSVIKPMRLEEGVELKILKIEIERRGSLKS